MTKKDELTIKLDSPHMAILTYDLSDIDGERTFNLANKASEKAIELFDFQQKLRSVFKHGCTGYSTVFSEKINVTEEVLEFAELIYCNLPTFEEF